MSRHLEQDRGIAESRTSFRVEGDGRQVARLHGL